VAEVTGERIERSELSPTSTGVLVYVLKEPADVRANHRDLIHRSEAEHASNAHYPVISSASVLYFILQRVGKVLPR
jgi:hypothetical protein